MPGVCLSVLILISFLPAFAANVAGDVKCESCNNFNGLYVELSGSSRATQSPLRAPVSSDGRFLIGSVPNGEYNLLVTDNTGSILSREFLRVDSISRPVTVRVDQPFTAS